MRFLFPRTRFTNSGALMAQLSHLQTEIDEATEAAMTPDTAHTAEELFDVIHSAETALRILEEFHGVNLARARRDVEFKNTIRSYYE